MALSTPSAFRLGRASVVTVRLTRSGNETLHAVRLAVQVPQGWKVKPLGRTMFVTVRPSQAPRARFRVTPPAWAAATNATVHATAYLGGDALRENGATVPLSP